MKKTIKALALLLCVVMLLCLVTACGAGNQEPKTEDQAAEVKTDDTAAPEVKEGLSVDDYITRTWGVTTNLGGFLYGSSGASNETASTLVYDVLWNLDPITKEVSSKILEDWHYEDDLTFVVTLKPGVMFSNGEEAKAEDVLFSCTNFFDRGAQTANQFGPLDIENSYTEGDYTVYFKFTDPWGPGITNYNTHLLNKSWCDEVGWDSTDWYDAPCGSGPYEVTEFVTDDHFTLKLREDYWNTDETYYVDEWVIRFFPDASTMAIELEQGTIDGCNNLSKVDYGRYQSEGLAENVGLEVVNLNDVVHFLMGYENNEIWNDINFRKAIAYGVDWYAVGKQGYGELCIPATSMVGSNSPYYLETGAYEYDPEMAKQILADAGYEEGDIVLTCNMLESATYKPMSEALQYYLSELGITMNLQFYDMPTTFSMWLNPGGTDLGFQSNPNGSYVGDPRDTWMQIAPDGAFSHSRIGDEKFKEMYTEAIQTVDQEKRKELCNELQQYMHDNYLTIPMVEWQGVVGFRSDIFTQEEIHSVCLSHNCVLLNQLSMMG